MDQRSHAIRLLLVFALGCSAPDAKAQQAQARPPQEREEAPQPVALQGEAHVYDVELFPGARHEPSIAAPEAVLGVPVGTRPAHHGEVVRLWETWAGQSPRVRLEEYGRTYEGRPLLRALVSAPENLERLDGIRARIRRLHDPRGLSAEEERAIVADTPAVAWLGYSIHGDEISGVDGGLALAHHLIADTGEATAALLREVVVAIDPDMNPDGRERFLAMLVASAGAVPNLDVDSLHRGRWPHGRGNHYLFDMNRDWLAGVAPETRGRWRAVLDLPPQLFVDAHEMGALDTFLFYPQAAPLNPHLPGRLPDWQRRFAAASAEAFDRHGWSYYTREWADAWGPFYSDAWGSLNGAVGMLYEQARYGGQPLRRASGEVVTHREAAHRQAVASMAHLEILAQDRARMLQEYAAERRAALEPPGGARALVVRPGDHPQREAYLVATLLAQGVEVRRAREALELADAVDRFGGGRERLPAPAGSWIVPVRQSQSALVRAALEFDARMDEEALLAERRELEQKERSKIYDVTAWSLPLALDLDAWWAAAPDEAATEPVERAPALPAGLRPLADASVAPYGWIVDGAGDGAVVFAARALEDGLALQFADEPFESAGRAFARGSLLVRRHENGPDAAERVERAARAAQVEAFATASARAPGEGHDLGGGHFRPLARPRVALLSNAPVHADGFGHTWHLLDRVLGVPTSHLDAQALSSYDLRRYNVLVVPPARGSLAKLLEDQREALDAWVRSGGTLVAMEGSAAALCDAELGLTSVRLRRDALEELDVYAEEARRQRAARDVQVDVRAVYDGSAPEARGDADGGERGDGGRERSEPEAEALARQDAWKRRFAPRGAFLRAEVDPRHWLTAGCGDLLPVQFEGDQVLLARAPAHTPVRLAPAAELRVAGLLWPEARERLESSSYAAVERRGHGQVILFASQPGFRGQNLGTARLLANAVVLGPGAGAEQPLGW